MKKIVASTLGSVLALSLAAVSLAANGPTTRSLSPTQWGLPSSVVNSVALAKATAPSQATYPLRNSNPISPNCETCVSAEQGVNAALGGIPNKVVLYAIPSSFGAIRAFNGDDISARLKLVGVSGQSGLQAAYYGATLKGGWVQLRLGFDAPTVGHGEYPLTLTFENTQTGARALETVRVLVR